MKNILVWALALAFVTGCGDGSDMERPDRKSIASDDSAPGDNKSQTKTGQKEPAEGESGPSYSMDSVLLMNEIQFKGTHNSYHVAPSGSTEPEFQYTMPHLKEQLEEHGVRAFELDLHYYQGKFYVYHLPVDDQESTCPRLRDCLSAIHAWSKENPGHQPLQIYFDFRDDYDQEKLIDHLDELDQVVFEEFDRSRLLIPDDIIANSPDLETAIQERGWPTLGSVRGKTMFILWNFEDAPYKYTHDGTGYYGRPMFIASTYKGWRHAMILGMDTAWEQEEQISTAVSEGYFVRTRSDRLPGKGGDFETFRDIAFASGAQAVLTDYPEEGMREGYEMNVPGGTPSRCNPTIPREGCEPGHVEHPALLSP